VPIEEWPVTSEYVTGTNVLGLVFYSLLLGLAIGKMDAKGKSLSNFFNCLSEIIMKIMEWIMLCVVTSLALSLFKFYIFQLNFIRITQSKTLSYLA